MSRIDPHKQKVNLLSEIISLQKYLKTQQKFISPEANRRRVRELKQKENCFYAMVAKLQGVTYLRPFL